MGVRGRRLAGRVFLVFSGALILAAAQRCAAQKPAESPAQLPIQPSFHFSDITAAAGIHFQHTVSPEKKYLIESMAGGVLLLDYDGDGWLDIYFTNSSLSRVKKEWCSIATTAMAPSRMLRSKLT
jgi:hypothetical protein